MCVTCSERWQWRNWWWSRPTTTTTTMLPNQADIRFASHSCYSPSFYHRTRQLCCPLLPGISLALLEPNARFKRKRSNQATRCHDARLHNNLLPVNSTNRPSPECSGPFFKTTVCNRSQRKPRSKNSMTTKNDKDDDGDGDVQPTGTKQVLSEREAGYVVCYFAIQFSLFFFLNFEVAVRSLGSVSAYSVQGKARGAANWAWTDRIISYWPSATELLTNIVNTKFQLLYSYAR